MKQSSQNIFSSFWKDNFEKDNNTKESPSNNELELVLKEGSINKITKCINEIIQLENNEENCKKAIEVLEKYLFSHNDFFVSSFLFLLYDKVKIEYMARFYLQYCYEELLGQSRYSDIVNKYIMVEPQKLNGNYSENNGIYPYQHRGEDKEYSVHSFSNDIGQNLTLLKTPYGSIILDCGAKCGKRDNNAITKGDLLAFLGAYHVKVESIVAVIISHAHLDHYGSVSTLIEIGIPISKFYTDERTKEIIRNASGEDLLLQARPISSFFVANQTIKVHSYDNGHIIGSKLIVIRFDCITVIYTGDYCLHEQKTVKGLNIAQLCDDEYIKCGVDCLITESTYGRNVSSILPYYDAEKTLYSLVDKLLSYGYKIFMPAFAVGRSQELTLMFNKYHKVLIDGLSIKLTQTYEKILSTKISNSKVKYSTNENTKVENFNFNDIIIASSGMISENSTSAKYIEELFDSKQPVAIIRTGYLDSSEESYGYSVLQGWKKSGGLLFDVSLSAHASYSELFELLSTLKPHNIVAVHGSGITQSHDTQEDSIAEHNSKELPQDNEEGDSSTQNHHSTVNNVTTISDNNIQIKWRNAVKIGDETQKAGRSIQDSQSFITAFKLLIRAIRSNPQFNFVIDKLNEFDSCDNLYQFLKKVLLTDFVISTGTATSNTVQKSQNNDELPTKTCNDIFLSDIADVFYGIPIKGVDRQVEASAYRILKPQHIVGDSVQFDKKGTCYCSEEIISKIGTDNKAILRYGDVVIRATGRKNFAVINNLPSVLVANHNIVIIRAKEGHKHELNTFLTSQIWLKYALSDGQFSVSEVENLKVYCKDTPNKSEQSTNSHCEKISAIADVFWGTSIGSDLLTDDDTDMPIIDSANIVNGVINTEVKMKHCDFEALCQTTYYDKRGLLDNYDVLITRDGNVGLYEGIPQQALANNLLMVVRASENNKESLIKCVKNGLLVDAVKKCNVITKKSISNIILVL